jgi:hypothetical protein
LIIHEKGPKAERDRRQALGRYRQVCEFFRVKPLGDAELARLNNLQLYRLGEDLYGRQSPKAKRRFTNHLGLTTEDHLSYGYFIKALVGVHRATGWRKLAILVQAPFRYPGFVRRSKASAKSKGLDARTGEPLKKAQAEVAS